jgi:AraC family transcriptional regulator
MSNQSLVIDYRREDASGIVFPDTYTLAAKEDNNFQVHQYELAPHEAPGHSPEQHVIVTSNKSYPVLLKRELGGITKDECFKGGDIFISPANVFHSVCWDVPISFTLLLFDPKYLSSFAYEYIDPGSVELLPHFLQPDPIIHWTSQALTSQLQNHSYMDSASAFLANHLLRNYCSTKLRFKENTHGLSSMEIRQVNDYIDSYIDKKISLGELGRLVGMSQYHFSRLFKYSTGMAPHQYLIKRRMEEATHLLKNNNLDITAISKRLGFSSRNHFSNTFAQHFSLTPDKYRKML